MSLQTRIEALKQDIGKPRSTRGQKVRAAAIRFEERFREAPFTAEEFNGWMVNEPSLNGLSPTFARQRLQAAGYRNDMPHPFEIVLQRGKKNLWKVRAVEELFFTDDVPIAIVKSFQKWETKLQHSLQACDLDAKDRFKQFTIVAYYQAFRRCKQQALVGVSGMQDVVLQLTDSENGYLALAPSDKDDEA